MAQGMTDADTAAQGCEGLRTAAAGQCGAMQQNTTRLNDGYSATLYVMETKLKPKAKAKAKAKPKPKLKAKPKAKAKTKTKAKAKATPTPTCRLRLDALSVDIKLLHLDVSGVQQ
jgi:cell division septation protein DedD